MTSADTATRAGLVWQHVIWPTPLTEPVALGLLRRLAAERRAPVVALEARADPSGICYLIGAPPGYQATVRQHLETMVAGVVVVEPPAARQPIVTARRIRFSGRHQGVQAHDPLATTRAVLSALMAVRAGEHLVLQVILGPRHAPRALPSQGVSEPRSVLHTLLYGTSPSRDPDQRKALQAALGQHSFAATVRLGVTAPTAARRQTLLLGLLGAVATAEASHARVAITAERARGLNDARPPWRWPVQLSLTDLCQLTAWPIGETDQPLPGQPPRHPRPVAPTTTAQTGDRVIAEATAPGSDGQLGYSVSDALRHTWILGPNGTGKSTLLLNLIHQDMQAGRAVVVIEPKDLVRDILARVPAGRQGDVVVVDPLDSAPVGINPLQPSGRRHDVAADALFAVFYGLYGESLGPRSADILHNALSVLARRDDASLVMLPLLLTHTAFRRTVTGSAVRHDPIAAGPFWQWFDALSDDARSQVIAPLMNKLRPLLRPAMRATLGQRRPRVAMAHVLRESQILLVPLQQGVLGPATAQLLSAVILAELWHAIRERAALPEAQRPPVMIYIDEVQDFLRLPTDLADALATARSLGAAFHLAHQYRDQLPPAMRAAVDANARSRICFQLGATDAKVMAAGQSVLTAEDFTALGRYEIYASLVQHGSVQPWASGRTIAPPALSSDPATLRRCSRAQYGQALDGVEADFAALLTHAAPDDPVLGRRPRGSA
ncbi:type IV secretory system conjugative DNA transfer family protein [Prescottella equi]|uniref:type IV secretory system conjugative DNA transfer family protein n=1 Tax=Rhodococcus hoagii TaxID=43767 RepID=UPI003D9963ED